MEQEKLRQTGETQTEELDEFSSLLKASFKPRNEAAAAEVDNAITTLVREALADQSVVKEDVLDTVDEMIARLDEKLSEQMNEILHAPAFQQIESAWRGLAHLVNNSEPDATLKIRVMNISKSELDRELRSYPGAKWDQSPFFKKIYESGLGTLGGEPFGCLIGDYQFDHSSADVRVMRGVSMVAAAAHAPFFAAAAPTLLGMDSWNEINNPHDIGSLFETPDYAAWRGLRDSENSRYLALTMPRAMARLPYGQDSLPVEEFNFNEETDGHTGEKYSWMNAAYAMGTNIARAHKDYGWTVQIRGVQSGGEVLNLPAHTFSTDEGSIDMKCPTEVSITDRREAELSKAGLISLVHRSNTDKAAFIGAQSVYKPKKMQSPEATASENLSARIPYMFAVSRFAHYLKHMVRDKIGSNREREQLEYELQDWISSYVHISPANASEDEKARLPLAGAKVEVLEDPENPGYYVGKFLLRPHFQLEGMDIGMSLVSKLPSN
ncbi:type VI secretion system contractile sheath large subunit [Roseinatronobacter alkalisoli]|uniref:Type VI secretion system contractile sheath large subunit n=1 Tax=Roseinatronobacter alkalisoli TaxID=3028235 RepID=A0ABT5TCN7_9RHOB|nr:type VI secretion system contractile sheath large subunit [Roseinatronobacter sp. HJB301]MDD7972864.1 type VI secretion system contractile sheath large subunit [Roseinatronobacter sp. HJB301]